MTIREIAKLAEVSVATVSRVINNDAKVKEVTRKKINNIIKEYNYTPNSNAVKLSKKNNEKVIGLIVPDIGNSFFAEMVDIISSKAGEEEITLLLCNTGEEPIKEIKFLDLLLEYRVQGLIYIPSKKKNIEISSKIKEFEVQNIPIVLLDREVENLDIGGIFLDNFQASYMLAREILRSENENIHYLSGPLDTHSGLNRYLGFKKAVKESNRNYSISIGDFKFESGYQFGLNILERYKCNELAVYIANNSMALGFMKALKKKNIKNDEIRMAIFEISEVLDIVLDSKNYVACKIPNKNMAEAAFEMLKKKIEYKNWGKSENQKIYYNPLIINRM